MLEHYFYYRYVCRYSLYPYLVPTGVYNVYMNYLKLWGVVNSSDARGAEGPPKGP